MGKSERTFTVIDRESNEVRSTGLTATQVIGRHVALGERSASMQLLRYLKPGVQISLGDILVKRSDNA